MKKTMQRKLDNLTISLKRSYEAFDWLDKDAHQSKMQDIIDDLEQDILILGTELDLIELKEGLKE